MAATTIALTTDNPSPASDGPVATQPFHLVILEMGTGYDQHGQDITLAATRACKDAIGSNSIPAFRNGSIAGVSKEDMKLKLRLGVPDSAQSSLDLEAVKAVFPYGGLVKKVLNPFPDMERGFRSGDIIHIEVVSGGLVCSSGGVLEAFGDKNDECYVVNAAVYVGY